MSKFHTLTIQNIIQETANAVSIVFTIPENLKENYRFNAGQYVTLKAIIDGAEIRRAYSICSSVKSNELKVAVKAVKNGTFSVYATQHLKIGDTIEVHEPEGNFILEPKNNKNYIAFAAGSGITPVLSMIKTSLEDNETASFTLIYGNRLETDVIFKEELDTLQQKFTNRFNLHYIYSGQHITNAQFGRIDNTITTYFIRDIYKSIHFDNAYLCGPEAMIQTVSQTLKDSGFSDSQISFELFTSSSENKNSDFVKNGEAQVTVLLDDETFSFTMNQSDSVLSAALRNQLDAPYSCQGGVCSSCLAKITEGTAIMAKNTILTEVEVEEGFVLTCQAHPTSSRIVVNYDDV